MLLKKYHEILGIITGVRHENDYTIVTFSVQKEVEFPADAIAPEKLKNLIGKKASIFNCDGEYKIRTVRGRK